MEPKKKRTSRKKTSSAKRTKLRSQSPSSAASKKKPGQTTKAARKQGTPLSKATQSKPAASPSISKVASKKRPVPASPAPSVLFKEDPKPRKDQPSGPGRRFETTMPGQQPETPPSSTPIPDLPESYGTERIHLIARDPHWLFVHWDFAPGQIRHYSQLAADGQVHLRIHQPSATRNPIQEMVLPVDTRNWFLHVPHGGCSYYADIGYRTTDGDWKTISTSAGTVTPSDSLSEEQTLQFETFPPDMPFEILLKKVEEAAKEHEPLAVALKEMREEGWSDLPAPAEVAHGTWSPAQEKALAALVRLDEARRVWMGSLEVTELIRRHLHRDISSAAAAQLPGGAAPTMAQAAPGIVSSLSIAQPVKGKEKERPGEFWFNVNAELVLYGATDPKATVTIGPRPVQLRSDGTFSFRFALPDGVFHLPIEAQSPDGVETRKADFEFSRRTHYTGNVEAHPQDKNLDTPT